MNDVEHDLRELFDRKASSVGSVAPKLPVAVRKRSRSRELGTVLVGGFTILALVVGSVAVLRAVDTGRRSDRIATDDPWAGYEIFERTAVLGSFVVTSPSDFYLIDPRRDPRCIPDFGAAPGCDVYEAFQLSNYDPGLATPVCGASIPRGGAVLSVRGIFPDDEGQYLGDPPFPQPISGEVTDGLCGPGRYALSQIDGIRIIAWIGVGDGVAADDLTTLERAYDRLEIAPLNRESPAGDPDVASYVIAGGENAAGAWRLVARPSIPEADPANVEVELVGVEGGAVVEGFDVPLVTIQQAGGDPVFGAVSEDASAVELRTEGVVEATRMVPLPPTLDADFVLFFGSHEGDTAAHAIALDATGQQLGSASAVEPVAVTSEGSYVLYRFEAFGARWELSTFRSGDGCALRQLPSGTGTGGSCELSTTSGRGHAFVYGSLPSKAASAEIVTQAGRTFPCLQVIKGPSGRRYFVIPLEGGGPGQLRYVDAEGNVLRHQRVTWRDPGRPI